MGRNVLVVMLTLRMLFGSVVCCCTLSAWTSSLFGKTAANCCCAQPTDDASRDSTPAKPAKPAKHECPCRNGLNVMANPDGELFNFESLRAASWLDPSNLADTQASFGDVSDLPRKAFPTRFSVGPFAHCRGTEILRLLQTMRC